jgi:hypothetical protein
MSEDHEPTEADVPAAAPISSDAFTTLQALLELIVNEKACRERVRLLHGMGAAIEKQRAELAVERAEHDAIIQKERAELARLRDVLREREVKVHAGEGMLRHGEQILAERKGELDRARGRYQTVGPGGLVQEFAPGYRPDSHEAPVEDDVHVRHHDNTFAAGSTLVREPEITRRPRGRPPKRSAEI